MKSGFPLFTLLLILFQVSCSDALTNQSVAKTGQTGIISSKLGIDEIMSMVSNNHNHTKGETVSVEPVLEGEDTVLYLVNYAQGWSVMPADRRLPINLIASDKGSIAKEELFANESMEDYVRTMMKEIQPMVSNPVDMTEILPDCTKASNTPPMTFYDENGVWWAYAYKYVASSSVNRQQLPLVRTKWGQSYPWNVNTPYTSSARTSHCPTGCTNVAVAQLLYYLHNKTGNPDKSYLSFYTDSFYCEPADTNDGHILSSNEISYTTLADCWDEMPLNRSSASVSGAQLVSSLMVHLGYLFESGYTPSGTATYRAKVQPMLYSALSVSSTFTNYDLDIMVSQIYSSKMPVVLFMSRLNPDNPDQLLGHAFLADGYRKTTETYTYVYKTMDDSSTTYKEIENAEVHVNEYVSLNWGYNGSGDVNDQGGVIWYNLDSDFSYQSSTGAIVYDRNKSMLYVN